MKNYILKSVLLLTCMAGITPSPAQERQGSADVKPSARLQADLRAEDTELLVLHFWASWCIPCRDEMKVLADFHAQHYPALQQAGVRVLTVSNDLRNEDLNRFLSDYPVMFPVYFDPLAVLQDKYRVPALPATVIIDSNANIIDRLLGTQNWNEQSFVEGLYGYLQQSSESEFILLQD